MNTAFELIDKELIASLNFPKSDVLEDKEDISGRKNDLDRALSLGNLEHVKIKMGQSMGINMSQMGYYPQQVREANLTNPAYPQFGREEEQQNVAAQLRQLMSRNGISGSVVPVMNGFGGSSAQISGGLVRSSAY
jgi:hypothetical protein